MFEGAGWVVHGLGADVPMEHYPGKIDEHNADIFAMSAMMITTMMGMKKVVSMVRNKGLDCKMIISGAPVTQDIADLFGAEGFAESAGSAVQEVLIMPNGLDRYNTRVNFGLSIISDHRSSKIKESSYA